MKTNKCKHLFLFYYLSWYDMLYILFLYLAGEADANTKEWLLSQLMCKTLLRPKGRFLTESYHFTASVTQFGSTQRKCVQANFKNMQRANILLIIIETLCPILWYYHKHTPRPPTERFRSKYIHVSERSRQSPIECPSNPLCSETLQPI